MLTLAMNGPKLLAESKRHTLDTTTKFLNKRSQLVQLAPAEIEKNEIEKTIDDKSVESFLKGYKS